MTLLAEILVNFKIYLLVGTNSKVTQRFTSFITRPFWKVTKKHLSIRNFCLFNKKVLSSTVGHNVVRHILVGHDMVWSQRTANEGIQKLIPRVLGSIPNGVNFFFFSKFFIGVVVLKFFFVSSNSQDVLLEFFKNNSEIRRNNSWNSQNISWNFLK